MIKDDDFKILAIWDYTLFSPFPVIHDFDLGISFIGYEWDNTICSIFPIVFEV
jgi:hypothetical protein